MKTDTKSNWRNCTFFVLSSYTGQKNKYSDQVHKWIIGSEEDVSEEEIKDYGFEYLWGHGRLPEYQEWQKEVSDIGEHFTDIEYYQNGYYEIYKKDAFWVFKITMPSLN